ncbi:hypothetical protein HNO92_003352 [Chromobacterium alkanivorans]|uniref:hypothetical protein n=1 Tax=Chromobacterium alkanivorans TaxID=1071719 RepID=UPI001967ECFC|nr:hypothetical protein [Chromobacterium alkanivorans]MBN3004293.1 hypothetical protein [Chromobacterium alkanivorans]MCS3805924.1 hypothetical protein [Chromobacterium alkanivorans]MCS3820262.1 hypothetical protein [Chromobacterium alkanivorans]MCS3875020.1 hypothetical protein [Chromobacterium alkanivorans]
MRYSTQIALFLAGLSLAAGAAALTLDIKAAASAPTAATADPGWSRGYDSKRFNEPPSELAQQQADQALRDKQQPKTPIDCQSHPGYAYCPPLNAKTLPPPAGGVR